MFDIFKKNNFKHQYFSKKILLYLQIHDLILTYLIEEMRPLSTVYKPSFRNLICGLIGCNEPDKFVPGKHIVRSKINNLYEIKNWTTSFIRKNKLIFVQPLIFDPVATRVT